MHFIPERYKPQWRVSRDTVTDVGILYRLEAIKPSLVAQVHQFFDNSPSWHRESTHLHEHDFTDGIRIVVREEI